MTKTYRLQIKYDEITTDNIEVAYNIVKSNFDGEILDNDGAFAFHTGVILTTSIPQSWLTEVKQPLTFDEWFKEKYPTKSDYTHVHDYAKSSWNAALENHNIVDEISDLHALSNLFDEIGATSGTMQENPTTDTVRTIWDAALKYVRGE